ncbi:hypothetical protein AB0C21_00215 [Spirillospora sp. NPDC049024]
MRRRRRVRALLAAASCAALAGCGIRPTGIITAGDPPMAQAHAAAITVYLVRGGEPGRGGELVPVTRPGLPGEPNLAIEQLTVPPTERERLMGLRTEVHERLDAYSVDDVSTPVGRRAQLVVRPADRKTGTRKWSRTAMAQIACTGQTIQGIQNVNLWSTLSTTRSEWRVLNCDDFSDLLG